MREIKETSYAGRNSRNNNKIEDRLLDLGKQRKVYLSKLK